VALVWRTWRLFSGRGACLADVAYVWRTSCCLAKETSGLFRSYRVFLILNILSHVLCSDFSLLTGLNVTVAQGRVGTKQKEDCSRPPACPSPVSAPTSSPGSITSFARRRPRLGTFTSDRIQRGQEHRSQAGGMKKR
jgi:hypothetical protein